MQFFRGWACDCENDLARPDLSVKDKNDFARLWKSLEELDVFKVLVLLSGPMAPSGLIYDILTSFSLTVIERKGEKITRIIHHAQG